MRKVLPDDDDRELQTDNFEIPKKDRSDREMDITPMIDITFLLLIFFIVCSTLDPQKTGSIPEAENALAISSKDSAVLFIEPAAANKAVVRRANETEFSADENIQSTEIIDYITREIEKPKGRNKQHVMIFGHADVKVGHVTRLQRIIGEAFEDLDSTYIAVKERR